jgi:hypothetical protein
MKNKLRSVRNGSKSAASPQSKTHHGNALDRPARKTRPDCNTIGILNQGFDGRLERDLAGRLFIVAPRNCDYTDVERREMSYDDAVAFVAKHTFWKEPRKFLALHGINAPSPGLKGADCLCMYQVGELAGEIPLVERQLPNTVIAAVRQGVTVDQFIADAIDEKLSRVAGASTPKQAVTCVFIFPDGSEVERVDFPCEVFSLIKRAAAKQGIALEQFFINAIRRYVAKCASRGGA